MLAALAAGHDSVQAIAESIYDGLAPALLPAAQENVRAHLEKLKREGRAVGRQRPVDDCSRLTEHHRMDNVIDFINVNRERYLDELKALLAIPSISALPEHAGDVQALRRLVRRRDAAHRPAERAG